jgi:uncharacterized cupin superfamily protein
MTTPKLIDALRDFATNPVTPEEDVVAAERMVSGEPSRTTTWNHYTDPTGEFFAGIWSSTVGAKKVAYTEEELCYILEGRVRLTDINGASKEFGPGSAFVIPAGFAGVWDTLEPVKKIYTIWQPRA